MELSGRGTVTGGVGKTRLALELATQSVGAFPDGVWLVELAGPNLAGAGTPADAVMAVLGIRDNTAIDPADLLAAVLRTSRMLLILDLLPSGYPSQLEIDRGPMTG